MVRVEVNKHAEIIKQQVFHTFPYGAFIPNFKGPHADDCPGCIIEAELQILVEKIAELSPVEDIVENLEEEKRKNADFVEDRKNAFKAAGGKDTGEMTLTDLVSSIVEERIRLSKILVEVSNDLKRLTRRLDNG